MPTLYVVATPIGNLSELSPRAIDTLREVSLILAEDTRVTRKLLAAFDIHTPMQSNHRHNEREQAVSMARRMIEQNIDVALVSDAGTPAISDPGAAIACAAAELGIKVCPIAGPSAVTAALSICGFTGTGYTFYGFAPREEGARVLFLQSIAKGTQRIGVLYESPHRIRKLVSSIASTLPEAQLCLCCDLTKHYELTLRGQADTVLSSLQANPKANKGEYVLVIDTTACPAPEPPQKEISPKALLLSYLVEGHDLKSAQTLAIEQGMPRNLAYQTALYLKKWLADPFLYNDT